LGGDEFIIALWHVTGTEDAARVALKMIEAVAQPYSIEGHNVSITTSVGVGIYPAHGEDTSTLMKSADLALYEAKHAGKNAFRISERTDLSTPARRQHDLPGAPSDAPLEKMPEKIKMKNV
jgi:two-component system cell cycle response regulator